MLFNSSILSKRIPYKIVCLFRDPIERNISAFFDAFNLHTGLKPQNYTGSLEALKQIFYDKLNHDYPLIWFEKQFKEATGVAIYSTDFNTELDYKIIKKNNVEILLMNSQIADEKKEDLLIDFFDLKTFTLKNRNLSHKKEFYWLQPIKYKKKRNRLLVFNLLGVMGLFCHFRCKAEFYRWIFFNN